MRRFFGSYLCLIFLCLLAPNLTFAQISNSDEETDMDSVEAELDRSRPRPQSTVQEQETNLKEPERISDLGKLAPFAEISVIQRRFLPKTGRFQFQIGLAAIANDPWFFGNGVGGRLGYAFREAWAVELAYAFLSTGEKDAVKALKGNNNVNTDSIINAKNYLGVDITWSPFYGKLALNNKRIVPFDMYFSAGLGQTGLTNARQSSATGFKFGGGQIFAMSKGIGFRWDLSWSFYNATPNPSAASLSSAPGQGQFNNLVLLLGASFFFPEASYR